MQLSDLLYPHEYSTHDNAAEIPVIGIASDTRKMKNGEVFVALPGRKHNALRLLSESSAVPSALVVENDAKIPESLKNIPVFFVSSPHKALAFMYSRLAGSPEKKLSVIGITGTAGKSSTAEMLYRVVSSAGIKTALIGTVHTVIDGQIEERDPDTRTMTTPEPHVLYPLLKRIADCGVTHVIMEVSSQALMLERVAPISFSLAVFTNLSPEHLDFHGTMEAYFLAKARLFASAKVSLINIDDASGKRMLRYAKGKVYTAGILENADFNAAELTFGCVADYTLLAPSCAFRLHLPLPGAFMVYNSLFAAAAALLLDVPPLHIKRCYRDMSMISGRMETLDNSRFSVGFQVMIDYAHTPDALKNLLLAARPLTCGRLILLFGCGGDRDKHKRAAMGNIAEKYADIIILTADNSRSEATRDILTEIQSGIRKYQNICVIPDRKAAIRHALDIAEENDLVLLVGKGHETYEIDQSGMHTFDERSIVTEYLQKKNGGKQSYAD